MGDVINMFARRSDWREVFKYSDDYTSMHVFVDERTGEVEVFQINDDNKSNRTVLPAPVARMFLETLEGFLKK